MTPDTPVIVDVRGGYRAITLNRPDKLNAFNEPMHQALRKAIDEAEADESCRALLITGAGRGFCTGQDLSDRLAKPGETVVRREPFASTVVVVRPRSSSERP